MSLNLINLDYTEWSREDWTDAYTAYCKTNLFGPMSKREYYDWVRSRLDHQKSVAEPLSEDLRNTWANGWGKAVVWAKNRKCNMNGVALESCRPEINLEELQNDVREIQWQLTNKGV